MNSENRKAVSKANAPTTSSITAGADVDKMEISDTELEYFASLEYSDVCSAVNLDGHFDDDDINSESEINPTGRKDLNLTEDMSGLQITQQSTDEQIAEAIKISLRDIPSPPDAVMSTSTKEGIRERYHSTLKHKEPSNTDDVRLFLSDLRGVLQHEPNFLEIQRPLSSLLRENVIFSWGEIEQQSWDTIMSTVTQKLTDQSIQPTEYNPISDSEVSEGRRRRGKQRNKPVGCLMNLD